MRRMQATGLCILIGALISAQYQNFWTTEIIFIIGTIPFIIGAERD